MIVLPRLVAVALGGISCIGLNVTASAEVTTRAGAVSFTSPPAHGAVELGREVRFRLTDDRCTTSQARVVVRFGGARVLGPVARGCSGTAIIPSYGDLALRGWTEGSPVRIELVSGSATLPLRHKHLQPDVGTVVAGNARVVPAAGDPQGDVNALAMSAGDVVDLGLVDLRGIYAVAVRAAGAAAYELRHGKPDAPAAVSENMGHTHAGLEPIPDWSIRRPGWTRTPWLLTTAKVLRRPPSGAARLYLTVTQGSALVNWVDLTGSGVMQPYRRPAPLPGSFPLFNGKDLRGWKHVGTQSFRVKDGAMEAQGCPTPDNPSIDNYDQNCIGFQYYARRQFKDFRLRLDFQEVTFGDNGGVLIRHDETPTLSTAEEIQMTDAYTELFGGIDHVQEADRQPQSSPGDWSTMEIIANGPRVLVSINGIVTSRYDGSTGCSYPAPNPCYGGANGGFGDGGRGYVSVENEFGKVRYKNLEMYECRGRDDLLCATDVPVLLQLART